MKRQLDNERLLGLVKYSGLESGYVYGYRKVTSNLKGLSEACSKHRVAKLMKLEGIKALRTKAIATASLLLLPITRLLGNLRLLNRIDIR